MKKWLRPSITRKFVLVLSGFLLLQLLQLGVGVYNTVRTGKLGALIGAVSEQRLQTLVLADLALVVSRGGRNAVQTRSELGFSMIRYDRGLLEIEESLASLGGDRETVLALIAEARTAWHEKFYPQLERAHKGSPSDIRLALAEYDMWVPAQLWRMDRIMALLEEEEREGARRLAVFQAFVVGASLLLMVFGVWLMRYLIVRPLRRFIEATRAIADGAFDRRVDDNFYDELGELARMFNRMAAAVGDKTQRLHAMNEVALVVTSSLSPEQTLDQILLYGMPLSGASGICIDFYDDRMGRFQYHATRGLSREFVESLALPAGALANDVMCRGEPVISNDLPASRYPLSPAARKDGVRSVICLPFASETQRLGVIYFFRKDRDSFDFEEIELIQTFSRLAAHALQNARVHATTLNLAETDSLTGLYNRRKLEQRLPEEVVRAQRLRHPLALAMLDIDHFKKINDEHGHAAGDTVLKELAAIFRRELRDIDLVVRFGGEEFVFVLPGSDSDEAYGAAERIRLAVAAKPIVLDDGGQLNVTVSVGVACFPRNAVSAQAMVRAADRALYAAKQQGRNRSILDDADAQRSQAVAETNSN